MFFKRSAKENQFNMLSERIKNDLVSTFQRKGIIVRDIKVDLNYRKNNLEVLIVDRFGS